MVQLSHPTRPPASGRPPRLAALDGLRLLAALMVVLYHYVGLGHGWSTSSRTLFPEVFPFAAYGWLGVQLFFLISGFVICMSCWGRSLGDFFTSRVVRLYPAYWFCVLATTAVLVLVPGGYVRLAWPDVLTNLTMVQAFLGVKPVDPVYWTLFAELRFYLLFAFVAWRGLTYRRVLLFCCLWGTAALTFDRFGFGAFGQFLMPEHCWFFIAGMAFYLMYRFRPTVVLWGVVLVSFAAAVPTARATWRVSVKNMDQWVPFWPVMAVLTVSFLAVAARRRSTDVPALPAPPVHRVGARHIRREAPAAPPVGPARRSARPHADRRLPGAPDHRGAGRPLAEAADPGRHRGRGRTGRARPHGRPEGYPSRAPGGPLPLRVVGPRTRDRYAGQPWRAPYRGRLEQPCPWLGRPLAALEDRARPLRPSAPPRRSSNGVTGR
ncbi:acyltransferase family protein [Streptomyces fradiae]|uniref:acyltransferase family protein n=1 Tax=Streptomyces fradiae TaxID=1906 RepID=UPI0036BEDC74